MEKVGLGLEYMKTFVDECIALSYDKLWSIVAATCRFWNENFGRGHYVDTWLVQICSGAELLFSCGKLDHDQVR